MLPGMRRSGVLALLVACVVPLSGCVRIIEGLPTSLQPPVSAVPSGEIEIVGASGDPIDQLARNALADLQDFWTAQFPDAFGDRFQPLQGGFFSVDPGNIDRRVYPNGVGCGSDPRDVENNAFYCQARGEPNSDSISYDRAFLAELADQFGDFIPDLVMAHEFGHAVQARVGSPRSSIATETQADCFAGAWTSWVAGGNARHTTVRAPELDQVLRGYLQLRDPVGTGQGEQQAHGSYFDRVSAFQEGFGDGVTACRDNFPDNRVFTQQGFSRGDLETGGNAPGNAPYDGLPDIIRSTLDPFWEDVVGSRGKNFDAPRVESLDGRAPRCAGDRELDYCTDENVAAVDGAQLGQTIYQQIGDFAVISAVSVPYALAARKQLGLSTDDTDAVRSAVCLTGTYGRALFDQKIDQPTQPPVSISPGDIDEGVIFLLDYGKDPKVFPQSDLTGFELVDVFRTGFVRGVKACGLGT
jgi:predicted metalloprotease